MAPVGPGPGPGLGPGPGPGLQSLELSANLGKNVSPFEGKYHRIG